MGSGIATALLLSGTKVVIKEINQKLLDNAVKIVTRNINRAVSRHRLTKDQGSRLLSMITPTLRFENFVKVDMVIEVRSLHLLPGSVAWLSN